MKKILLPSFLGLGLLMSPQTFAFSDVTPLHANYDAINYVQEEDIVKGYPDGTYQPDKAINRAEFTKIIVEAVVGQVATENNRKCFTDVETDQWFFSYVCYSKKEGILGGYPDGTFKPGQNITFVEAAKIIVNAYKYSAGTDEEVWYKPFVDSLAGMNAIPTTIKSFSKNLTRGEMAEIIYRLSNNITTKDSTDYDTLSGKMPGTSPTPTPEATAPKTITVTISNFSFGPAQTIRVGDTVTWVNDDPMDHSIKSDFFGGESDRMRNGQSVQFTFKQAGTFNYECGVHPGMMGTIVVNP